MFDQVVWLEDRMLLGDLLFRLEVGRPDSDSEDWRRDDRYFNFFKPKELIDQYQEFLSRKASFQPKNIVELGIWDGGSLALWCEIFQPDKLVGIDLLTRGDSDYFRSYVESRHLQDTVRTYWGINQADKPALLNIITESFREPLDLVIDDASHYYEETRSTFEILFPLLRPGGLYILEDWQWGHWREFQNHPYFAGKIELTCLVREIIESTGSATAASPSEVSVYSRMVVIERGPL